MVVVYQMIGEDGPARRVTDKGEVLARREPVAGGMTVLTAMVLVPNDGEWPFLVLFCADGGKSCKTREEAADYASAWQSK